MNGIRFFNVAFHSARLGFWQFLREPVSITFGIILYTILIVSYAGIIKLIPLEDLLEKKVSVYQLIWYIGITEFVLFCGSFSYFRELRQEIQSDQIYFSLLRPCPLWVVKVGEWSGQCACRFVTLALPAYALVYFLAGQNGLSMEAISGIVVSLPGAGLLSLLWSFVIAASCVWLPQTEPLFWVWQKCLFLCGALLWPLALYPDILSGIVWLTPFPAMLAVAGNWVIYSNPSEHATEILYQVCWVACLILGVIYVDRALLRQIQRRG